MKSRTRALIVAVVLAVLAMVPAASAAAAGGDPAGIGLVDPATGQWYLRDPATGSTTSFYFGNPGDEPFVGDWDCDGVDTPGLYRRSDGYVYLRNSNTQGIADVAFFFGNPGDVPLPGDFDGDGCDTVSIYRPAAGRFYLIDRLGQGDAGLGVADVDFTFGDLGDQPLAGDFDGDGVDTVGVFRAADSRVHLDGGREIAFGEAHDVMLAGAWAGGEDLLASHRPGRGVFVLTGDGALEVAYGNESHRPVAGRFGALPGGDDPPPVQPPYPDVGSGKRIIYSNTEQRVWLIDADGTLVKTHPVSGRQGVPMPGTYSVWSKSQKAWAAYGGITMQYMVRFAHGRRLPYGFHSIPVYPDGRPLQLESELGTFQSAGCVRQRLDDAVFLYEWAELGTTVHALP